MINNKQFKEITCECNNYFSLTKIVAICLSDSIFSLQSIQSIVHNPEGESGYQFDITKI